MKCGISTGCKERTPSGMGAYAISNSLAQGRGAAEDTVSTCSVIPADRRSPEGSQVKATPAHHLPSFPSRDI